MSFTKLCSIILEFQIIDVENFNFPLYQMEIISCLEYLIPLLYEACIIWDLSGINQLDRYTCVNIQQSITTKKNTKENWYKTEIKIKSVDKTKQQ